MHRTYVFMYLCIYVGMYVCMYVCRRLGGASPACPAPRNREIEISDSESWESEGWACLWVLFAMSWSSSSLGVCEGYRFRAIHVGFKAFL